MLFVFGSGDCQKSKARPGKKKAQSFADNLTYEMLFEFCFDLNIISKSNSVFTENLDLKFKIKIKIFFTCSQHRQEFVYLRGKFDKSTIPIKDFSNFCIRLYS